MSDLTKKILLGLGFGAAVATPLAITYYFLSRDEYQLQDLRQPRRKQSLEKDEQTQIFVQIREDAVGAVIGKGGQTVRRIQDETKTRIDFREDKSKKGDKVATITGTADAVYDAEAYIHRIISSQPVMYQETIYVPHDFVGRVIGKDGENVRTISSTTETKIDIARIVPPNVPGNPITIKGSMDNIKLAKKKIEEIIGRKSRNSFNKSRNNSFKIQRTKTFSPKKNGKDGEPGTEELIPTQDGHLQVYVSAAKSPSKFWVQIHGTKSNELDKLTEAMTDFYEVKRNFHENQLSEPKVGDIIAAPFKMDESWYRVKIVSIEGDRICVYYLDFGDECFHPKESLCSLKPEFLSSLPFQAAECSLSGVVPVDSEEWSVDATKVFCDLTHAGNWIEVKACPVDKIESIVSVEILDFKDLEWPINVADDLVARKLASRSPE